MRSSASDKAEHVGSGSELLLEFVGLSDSGTYMCNASNPQGSATAHATVRVTGLTHYSLALSVVFLFS